jgi:hypothetical protein
MLPNALTWSLTDDEDRRLVDVQFLDAKCRDAGPRKRLDGLAMPYTSHWACVNHAGIHQKILSRRDPDRNQAFVAL